MIHGKPRSFDSVKVEVRNGVMFDFFRLAFFTSFVKGSLYVKALSCIIFKNPNTTFIH